MTRHSSVFARIPTLNPSEQEPFSSMAVNKVEFCRRFILPKTRVVPKYIGLYRRLLKAERGVLAFKKMEKSAPVAASSSSSTTASPSRSLDSDSSANKCSDSDRGDEAESKGSGEKGAREGQAEGDVESEIEDF